jgi:hypothetical protein
MRPLTELREHDGELLRSHDLSAALSAEAWRWAVHLRLVHHTWGVALGFELEALGDEPAIAIGPGLGYDCHGTEILNAGRVVLPLPYDTDEADLVVTERCGPRFDWRETGRACNDELLLAHGYFKGDRAVGLDESVRHWCHARRFRIASGIAQQTRLKNKLTVSTATGGFTTTPFYFATLEAKAQLAATLELSNETEHGFLLTLRAPDDDWRQVNKDKPGANVHWVGVEPLVACALANKEST